MYMQELITKLCMVLHCSDMKVRMISMESTIQVGKFGCNWSRVVFQRMVRQSINDENKKLRQPLEIVPIANNMINTYISNAEDSRVHDSLRKAYFRMHHCRLFQGV